MDNDSLTELIELKNTADLTSTEGRLEFLQRLYPIIENWHGRRPDLPQLFQPEEIEELLVLDYEENEYFRRSIAFVNFVSGFDYKFRARLDATGSPILQRTTPIHLVARRTSFCYSSALYKIYQPDYTSNYRDESGFTHFHAACKFGFHWVVGEFLVFGGIDPDLVVDATGDRPLHLAIRHERKGVASQLLLAGADPNPANEAGVTPLHLACRKQDEGAWARKLLVESQQSIGPQLRIDARAVRLAVTSLQAHVLVELLRCGFAGWDDFVFPEAQEFAEIFAEFRGEDRFAVRLAAGALGIYRICERHVGHNRGAALTIMKAFDDHGLLERSARAVTSWRLELKEATSRMERDRKLEFHDLIRLRPSEAVKRFVTSAQYHKLASSKKLWMLPERLWEPCSLYLCEIIMRILCRHWALDSFVRTIQFELPLVCCLKIIDNMTARDMYHICLAEDL